MTERIGLLLLSIAGTIVVALLFFAGFDLYREAGKGPRLKQKLVTAGLCLLAWLGIISGTAQGTAAEPPMIARATPADIIARNQGLGEMPVWKSIETTWEQAMEVASGKKGSYPFDGKGKKALLASLGDAQKQIDGLVAGGALTEREASLLKGEFSYLARAVGEFRPTEMQMATCYEPMDISSVAKDRVERISQRLSLIEKMQKAGTVKPEVASKVISTLELDVAALNNRKEIDSLRGEDRARAEKMVKKAQGEIRALREKMKRGAPGQE